MHKSYIDTMVSRWRKDEIALNPGATEEQIDRAEARLCIRFPEDVRAFYRACNGFDTSVGYQPDWEGNVFLSLEELGCKGVHADPGGITGPADYVIADFCVAARLIVCRLTDSMDNPAPVFWDDCDGKLTPIRPSFGDFIEHYATDLKATFCDT